jgi:GNAT superfamily N-acetyltransferase
MIVFTLFYFTLLYFTLLPFYFCFFSCYIFSILSLFTFFLFPFLPYFLSLSLLQLFSSSLFFPGEVEGFLGVIRFLGVLPRYHGLCIGRRLICRVEEIMAKKDCVRCMCCIPGPRSSMAHWVQRRGEGESVAYGL